MDPGPHREPRQGGSAAGTGRMTHAAPAANPAFPVSFAAARGRRAARPQSGPGQRPEPDIRRRSGAAEPPQKQI